MIKDYCAGGLVFHNGKLLTLQRFNKVWLFPKGHIDPGETAQQAAIREVKEESGLGAEIIGSLGESDYTFKASGLDHSKNVRWFLMFATSTAIQLEPGFFIDYQWLELHQVEQLSFKPDQELARRGFGEYSKWKGQSK